jgi:hypothetical protein
VFAFGGSASAKIVLFGWDLAGVSVAFDYTSATGKITITGSIHLDFWLFEVNVSHTFSIGLFKLPPPVFLGASSAVNQLLNGSAVEEDGILYLNMGARAGYRDLEESELDETFIIEHLDGTAGDETIQVSAFGRSQKFTGVSRIIADGGTGDDMILVKEGVLASVELSGGAGNDVIIHEGIGSGTSNTINGGDGNDFLMLGNAILAAITMNGGTGDDYIRGGPGADTINGDAGNDQIFGMAGNDTINAGDGDDVIVGGTGNDTLNGGDGADTFEWVVGDGVDTITGGTGADTLRVTASNDAESFTISGTSTSASISWTGYSVSGSGLEALELDLAGGADTLTVENLTGTASRTSSLMLVPCIIRRVQAPSCRVMDQRTV